MHTFFSSHFEHTLHLLVAVDLSEEHDTPAFANPRVYHHPRRASNYPNLSKFPQIEKFEYIDGAVAVARLLKM